MRQQQELKVVIQAYSQNFIACRTRTGKEIHLASTGSSVLQCGVWLKTNSTRYYVDAPITCEKCLNRLEVLKNSIK